ncbi:MAG: SDR family oxidoreductase [Planctomycetes bacterium]|nr:SDR family oxidoreductase [Planctomycetota bacterium]
MGSNYYHGKLAILTGASEGIGKSLAFELLRHGARVVICSRSTDKLRAAVSELQSTGQDANRSVAYRAFDLVEYDETERNIGSIVEEFGRPHFLMNCAGFAHPGYVEDLQPAHFRSMMEVNYLGTVHACKATLPHLQDGQSHILNISSVAGFVGLFGNAGYCATKYAVIGFSEALRSEVFHRGICVSVLCPPNTRTPGLDRENRMKPAEVLATEEKVSVMEPAEVARATLKALPKGRPLILPSFECRAAHRLSRFLPGVLRRLTRRPNV